MSDSGYQFMAQLRSPYGTCWSESPYGPGTAWAARANGWLPSGPNDKDSLRCLPDPIPAESSMFFGRPPCPDAPCVKCGRIGVVRDAGAGVEMPGSGMGSNWTEGVFAGMGPHCPGCKANMMTLLGGHAPSDTVGIL